MANVSMQANFGGYHPMSAYRPDDSLSRMGDRFANMARNLPGAIREGEQWAQERNQRKADAALNEQLFRELEAINNKAKNEGYTDGEEKLISVAGPLKGEAHAVYKARVTDYLKSMIDTDNTGQYKAILGKVAFGRVDSEALNEQSARALSSGQNSASTASTPMAGYNLPAENTEQNGMDFATSIRPSGTPLSTLPVKKTTVTGMLQAASAGTPLEAMTNAAGINDGPVGAIAAQPIGHGRAQNSDFQALVKRRSEEEDIRNTRHQNGLDAAKSNGWNTGGDWDDESWYSPAPPSAEEPTTGAPLTSAPSPPATAPTTAPTTPMAVNPSLAQASPIKTTRLQGVGTIVQVDKLSPGERAHFNSEIERVRGVINRYDAKITNLESKVTSAQEEVDRYDTANYSGTKTAKRAQEKLKEFKAELRDAENARDNAHLKLNSLYTELRPDIKTVPEKQARSGNTAAITDERDKDKYMIGRADKAKKALSDAASLKSRVGKDNALAEKTLRAAGFDDLADAFENVTVSAFLSNYDRNMESLNSQLGSARGMLSESNGELAKSYTRHEAPTVQREIRTVADDIFNELKAKVTPARTDHRGNPTGTATMSPKVITLSRFKAAVDAASGVMALSEEHITEAQKAARDRLLKAGYTFIDG
jgi:hypothetical protein